MFSFVNSNIAVGWVSRSLVLVLSFTNTRLLIDAIGTEALAAYSILTSLLPWFALLNFGLPISVQNLISLLRSQGLNHQKLINKAYGAMLFIFILGVPIVFAVSFLLRKILLFNYSFVSIGAVAFICLCMFCSSIFQVLINVMHAEHDDFWPALYPVFGPIWMMMVLFLLKYFEPKSVNTYLFVISSSYLLVPAHAFIKMKVLSLAQIDIKNLLKNVNAAKEQLCFSLLSVITLSVDYIIISQMLGPSEIVIYNFANRLFLALLIIHGVQLTINWTQVSDMFHRKEFFAVRNKIKDLLISGGLITMVVGVIIIVESGPIVRLLTGGKYESIPADLCFAMLVYVLIRVWTDTFAMALNGFGMVSEINKFIFVQATISALLQYVLGSRCGAIGIIIGLIVSFLLTAAWIIPKKFYQMTEQL